jgi:hypothetical protein
MSVILFICLLKNAVSSYNCIAPDVRLIVNNELQNMCKKAVVADMELGVCLLIYTEGLRKSKKDFDHVSAAKIQTLLLPSTSQNG